jgi:transcriptional regulator with XRE-family HTH domain
MTKRIINKPLLRMCVKLIGKERVAVAAGCSASFIEKLMSEKYKGLPSITTIEGLSLATGKTVDELFPVFEAEKESA